MGLLAAVARVAGGRGADAIELIVRDAARTRLEATAATDLRVRVDSDVEYVLADESW